jgi:hypothetical protein
MERFNEVEGIDHFWQPFPWNAQPSNPAQAQANE